MNTQMKLLAVIPVALALLLPGSAFASFRYRGSTSQHEELSFLLDKHVTRLSRFDLDWDAKCTSGATLADATLFRRIRLSRNLHFLESGTYEYTAVNDGYSAANGRNLVFVVKGSLGGRLLRSGNMRGTWSSTVTVVDPTTAQPVDSCSSGHVSWKALLL